MQIPISIVMNLKSGHHGRGHELEIQLIAQSLQNANFDVAIFLTDQQTNLSQCIEKARVRHLKFAVDQRGIIVAAGGDGTINAVAQQLLDSHIALGILPLGTFNYVARALNIPLTLPEAVQNLIEGSDQFIHVAAVNGQVYLNNASIGVYPIIIEQREYYNKKFGRFPLVAYVSGLSVLLQPHKYYKLKIKIDGKHQPIDSPMIFFGNNQLQLQDLKLRLASCAAAGKLAGVALDKVSQWRLLKLMLRLFKGDLEQAEDVHAFCADHIEISAKRTCMKVALDGEIRSLKMPLRFEVLHDAIQVRVPNVTSSL